MHTRLSSNTGHFSRYGNLLFAVAGLTILMTLLVPGYAHAAVTAQVDRDTINEGETFTLTLTVTGSSSGQPDLSVLDKDFDVISSGERSEVQIINGSIQSHHAWSITLAPRHTGKLLIPPIALGNDQSTALTITVLPATASSNSGADKGDVFIEVNTKPAQVYVQAQLLYTVRLYYDAPLRQGTLSTPKLDNAVVQKLGDDTNFETQRGGRHYQVIERRYAIFPQNSGDLEIPAVVFDGAVDAPSTQTGDPFFDSFNRATRRVHLRSRKLTIQVAKQPADYHGVNWLPAQDIQLDQKWSPAQPQFRVGEPVTRTLTIRAKGLSASQLPDLVIPDQSGLKLYPDQPQTSSTPSGDTLVSTREQKIAMIPTQAGEVKLPAIELNWWDTQTQQERTAMLPAQTIHVLPGAAGVTNTTPSAPAQPSTAAAPTQPEPASTATSAKSVAVAGATLTRQLPRLWIALTAFFALAWLITLLLWWRYKRPRPAPAGLRAVADDTSEQAEVKHIRQACAQNDAQRVKQALLAWARLRWFANPPLSLGALAARVDDASLANEIAGLDKCLYQGETPDWQANQLLQSFTHYLKRSNTREHTVKPAVLEPLHRSQTRVAGQ